MKIQYFKELACCKYSKWYNDYSKITTESKILKVPQNLLDYFKDEIIILPKECNFKSSFDSYDSSVNWDNTNEDDAIQVNQPEFLEFSNKVSEIIEYFGGCVFIKTDWHCPKDSYWITAGQTLKVKDLTDFYQLIKASSICKNDLAWDIEETDHEIIFKKWEDIDPKNEFRCYVKNQCIIAISPREWPQYHEYISLQKNDIINDIVTVFKENIKNKFRLNNYCFDVHRPRKDDVCLIDFAPFNKDSTESLAFEWNELQNEFLNDIELDEPEFRYINSEIGIQPNKRNNFGIPKDIIDMFKVSSEPGNEQVSNIQGNNNCEGDGTSLNDLLTRFYDMQTQTDQP